MAKPKLTKVIRNALRSALIKVGVWRPRIRPGDEIHIRQVGSSGTLGVFVTRGKSIFALTAEHVIAKRGNAPSSGHRVRSRSCASGADDARSLVLGSPARWGGIDYTEATPSFDAALIKVTTHRIGFEPHQIGAISDKTIPESEALDKNAAVCVFGADTKEVKRGRVQGIYNIKCETLTHFPYRIDGVYRIEVIGDGSDGLFCDKGDSGAIVWEDGQTPRRAVALLVAENFLHTGFAIPIEKILKHFDVALKAQP